jgi:hypothetical protein
VQARYRAGLGPTPTPTPTATPTITLTPSTTPTQGAGNSVVHISPASISVEVGQTFTVSVLIDSAQNLGGYEFDLAFDPGVLQAVRAAQGGFLGITGRTVGELGPIIDNTNGVIAYGAYSYSNSGGPAGNGMLAEIALVARSIASSPLTLQNVRLVDVEGNLQALSTQNGLVTVTPR